MEVFDNWTRPKTNLEPGGGPTKVESAGYMPVKLQVENLIAAGRRLDDYRKATYDYPEGEPDPEDIVVDPTRSSSFDLADATSGMAYSLAEQSRFNKARKEAEELAKAQEVAKADKKKE